MIDADEPDPNPRLSRARVIAFGVVILLLSAFWLSCHEYLNSNGARAPVETESQ